MFEQIVLGTIQGITEWTPLGSRACVLAAKVHLFSSTESLNALVRYTLFLHLGTGLAALIYFRRDLGCLFRTICSPQNAEPPERNLLVFLTVTTLLTGAGQWLIGLSPVLAYSAPQAKAAVNSLIAALLLAAGWRRKRSADEAVSVAGQPSAVNGLLLGLTQALSYLPGLSRTGLTVAALSARNFNAEAALRLSFLMDLPFVLNNSLLRNHRALLSPGSHWLGMLSAFIIGLVALAGLMRLARRISPGAFLLAFGALLALGVVTALLD
ncbi:MAG: undecaprenyl-diphosphate phosphatase [Candidatus Omnitrophica bacterium]|nr:undecaprenyl-diphosphate phosphatase [Candidatus Omnitrophota bacterium]